MEATFIANFNTFEEFSFRNFNNLFNKNKPSYKGAEIEYTANRDADHIYIRLDANGDPDACRHAIEDLLEKMMCSICTSKYYLVGELYDKLYYFHDGLWESMNQDKANRMGCNQDGTHLSLHMREKNLPCVFY